MDSPITKANQFTEVVRELVGSKTCVAGDDKPLVCLLSWKNEDLSIFSLKQNIVSVNLSFFFVSFFFLNETGAGYPVDFQWTL